MSIAIKKKSVASRAVSTLVAVTLASSFINVGVVASASAAESSRTQAAAQEQVASDGNLGLMAKEAGEDCTVTFKNGDEVIGDAVTVKSGEKCPAFEGDEPTKDATAKGSYKFDGWTCNGVFVAKDKVTEQDITDDTTFEAHFAYTLSVKASDAIAELQKRYVMGGANAVTSPATSTDPAAYALYHKNVDLDAAGIKLAFWDDGLASTDVQRLSRWILTITAADLDAAVVTVMDGDKESEDTMMVRLNNLLKDRDCVIDELVWALPVYLNYTDDKNVVSGLVKQLLDKASTSENAVSEELAGDVTKQAQVLLALAPHYKTTTEIEKITSTEEKELAQRVVAFIDGEGGLKASILAAQNADGGYSRTVDSLAPMATARTSDVEATSYVISALCALDSTAGKNLPKSDDGLTGVDYLLSQIDDDLTGYADYTKDIAGADETAISAIALMGLEAAQLTKTVDKTTDVLEFPLDAKKRDNSGSSTSKTGSTTAKTGDNGLAGAAASLAIAGALGAWVACRRKDQADN